MKRKTCLAASVTAMFSLAAVAGILLLIGWQIGPSFLGRPANVDSALESTLEWGRLAPLPDSAQDIGVATEGSMFTRAFRVTFRASLDDIEQWIEDSPGLKESTVEAMGKSTTKHTIEPGRGAAYAEVVIIALDSETGLVEVYAYWS